MALARLPRDSDEYEWSSKIVINPVPVVQHPHSFTRARAGLVAVGVIFTLLGTFAIICRALTLIQRRRKMGYDDYAMFFAYICSIGFTIATFVSVRWGVGLRLADVPLYWGVRAIQAVYANEVCYYFTIFFVKLSLMFLYLRLAAELRGWFWYASLTLTGVLVVHFFTTVIVFSTQCLPLRKYWYPSIPGTCIDITAFFYSTNIFTILTDLIMLALPIPIVWKIPRPQAQKFGILAAFLVGGLGTLASCIRLYSIKIFTESRQPMRDAAPISTWSFIEINLGILCASASVIKPLFTKSVAPSLAAEQRSPKRFSSTAYPPTTASSIPSSGTRKSRNTISNELEKVSRWSICPARTHNAADRDVEVGTDIDGSPIRLSSPLPEVPRAYMSYSTKGDTGMPLRMEQPILHARVSREHMHESSLLTISCLPRLSPRE